MNTSAYHKAIHVKQSLAIEVIALLPDKEQIYTQSHYMKTPGFIIRFLSHRYSVYPEKHTHC